MSTKVFKSKMKKDMTICNLRKAHGFSCRRCVCNGICNPAFEIYEYRKNRVYYLDEEEAKHVFDMDMSCEKAEALTGIGRGIIQYYRVLIRKGAYKDVRKTGSKGVAFTERKATGKEECYQKSIEGNGCSEKRGRK